MDTVETEGRENGGEQIYKTCYPPFPVSPPVLDCPPHCPLFTHPLGQATLTTLLKKQVM